jgi:beta-lactamase regulating signal transducer with metallopeptidase domain
VLSIAMACVAIAPALGVLLPSWTSTLVTLPSIFVTTTGVERRSPTTDVPPSAIDVAPVGGSSRVVGRPASEAEIHELAPAASAGNAVPPTTVGLLSLVPWIEGIYVAGAVSAFATLLAGLLRLAWLTARSEPIEDGPWHEQLTATMRSSGVGRSVGLRRAQHPSVLATWGILRPRVLLPAGSDDWPADCVRVVLLHELAHIRRHDWIVQILASVLRAAYWFNPLIWIAASRLRRESEQACDDTVIEQGVSGREYAGCLLTLARTLNRRAISWIPAPSMARASMLRRRIASLLDPATNHARPTRSSIIIVAAVLLFTTGPVAAFHLRPQSPSIDDAQADRSAPTASARLRASASATAAARAPVVEATEPTTANASRATSNGTTDLPKRASDTSISPRPFAAHDERRSAQAIATRTLDVIHSTFSKSTSAPCGGPSARVGRAEGTAPAYTPGCDELSAHTFLMTTVDRAQQAAEAVVSDDGRDPAGMPTKSTALITALAYAADASANVASRPRTAPSMTRSLEQLTSALREQSAALTAIILPVRAAASTTVAATPAHRAAIEVLDLTRVTRGDTSFVGPHAHTFLATSLDTLERAARSVVSDDGASVSATKAREDALSSAIGTTANVATDIASRVTDSASARQQAAGLAASLRTLASQLDAQMPAHFSIRLPRDVYPERATVFYSLASSGRMPELLRTMPDVFDYAIDVGTARVLKLLIVVPGYQVVAVELSGSQLDAPTPYMPPLVPSAPVTISGTLVDSSGRPVRGYGLELGYKFLETVAYFCNCMLDGSVPSMSIGRTRTDDAGAFSFMVPNVREDPFFRQYSKSAGSFFLSSTAHGRLDLFDDTLRPSLFTAKVLIGARPLVVAHVDHGALSGHLARAILRQSGLDDDLGHYRFNITPGPDHRPLLELSAETSSPANGFVGYSAMLQPDGSFEAELPPGTYDLQLRISTYGGASTRSIPIGKDVIVRENQHTVVDRR